MRYHPFYIPRDCSLYFIDLFSLFLSMQVVVEGSTLCNIYYFKESK